MINEITFAGHSAVFLKGEDYVIGIDPWLEGNPSCPDELKNPQRLDLVVLTHGHADHAGDAVRLGKDYGCTFVATYELAMILIQEGVPEHNVIPMNKGGSVQNEGISITLTDAYHSSSYETKDGPVYAGEACGAVIQAGEKTFYHAGDTSLFSDMKLIGERYKPLVAFLPIGDRFTMDPVDAAIAAALVQCTLAIPIHWGTFDLLTGTPEEFEKDCAKGNIEAKTLQPGETFSF